MKINFIDRAEEIASKQLVNFGFDSFEGWGVTFLNVTFYDSSIKCQLSIIMAKLKMISVHSSSSSQKSGTPHTYTYTTEMLSLDTMAKSYIKSPLYNGIEIEVVMMWNGGRVRWMWWWVCCKRKEVTDMKISQQKPQIDNSKPSSVVRQQNEHKEASRERDREKE